jgi:hypothetical protein
VDLEAKNQVPQSFQFFDKTEVRKQTSGIKNEDYFEKR